MNRKKIIPYLSGTIFIFALSCVCVLILTITQKSSQANNSLINEQFVKSFINEKVKRAQQVEIQQIANKQVLLLKDGSSYLSYLYLDHGYLEELYLLASRDFNATYGDPICPVATLSLAIEHELLIINNEYYINLAGKL